MYKHHDTHSKQYDDTQQKNIYSLVETAENLVNRIRHRFIIWWFKIDGENERKVAQRKYRVKKTNWKMKNNLKD